MDCHRGREKAGALSALSSVRDFLSLVLVEVLMTDADKDGPGDGVIYAEVSRRLWRGPDLAQLIDEFLDDGSAQFKSLQQQPIEARRLKCKKLTKLS
jgi:hypothetical protein